MTERTPADFKAAREASGLSQQALADALGVNKRSVKRWESGENPAPGDAWDALDAQLARRDAAMDWAWELVERICESEDFPGMTLTYWRSQEEFDAHGRDEGYYGCANANARAVADVLRSCEVSCRFAYFDGGAVSTPGSRY